MLLFAEHIACSIPMQYLCMQFTSLLFVRYNAAKHKTNANYGNSVYDKVEKRVAKNLFYDSRV